MVVLALVPAYCSIDGLVTGETLAMEKRARSYSGPAGIVTAISYGLFATALAIAAARYFASDSKRQRALFRWASNVAMVAAVLFFSGRFVWMLQ